LDQSIYVAIPKRNGKSDLLYLLGILTSAVAGWYLIRKHALYDTLYPWFTKEQLAKFPIPNNADKTERKRLIQLVDRMLSAKKAEAKSEGGRREHWTRQCEALDRQIDALVYELYGLTDREIALVEHGR
jgi:hypothetical protein